MKIRSIKDSSTQYDTTIVHSALGAFTSYVTTVDPCEEYLDLFDGMDRKQRDQSTIVRKRWCDATAQYVTRTEPSEQPLYVSMLPLVNGSIERENFKIPNLPTSNEKSSKEKFKIGKCVKKALSSPFNIIFARNFTDDDRTLMKLRAEKRRLRKKLVSQIGKHNLSRDELTHLEKNLIGASKNLSSATRELNRWTPMDEAKDTRNIPCSLETITAEEEHTREGESKRETNKLIKLNYKNMEDNFNQAKQTLQDDAEKIPGLKEYQALIRFSDQNRGNGLLYV